MKTLITVFCCLALGLLCGCKKSTKEKDARAGQDEAGGVDNKHCEKLLAGELSEGDKAQEARAWLNDSKAGNALWKTSREQTLQWVNDFYQAGAVKVLAVYSPKDETIKINMCAELMIVMPTDKEARQRTLKAYRKIERELWGEDAEKVKDHGQKFLLLNMDP